MSLVLLNALLILVGPFLVVSPLALAAHIQLSDGRRRPRRLPVWRPAMASWAVA